MFESLLYPCRNYAPSERVVYSLERGGTGNAKTPHLMGASHQKTLFKIPNTHDWIQILGEILEGGYEGSNMDVLTAVKNNIQKRKGSARVIAKIPVRTSRKVPE
jgi:hypothetical protein